jgi:4-amino-4-deoxy-L-arabinose transferase-like glycosyltransferase
VLVTYWAALAFVSRRGAVLAALMMAASVLLGVEARLAKTDAVLLMCITAAMGAMAHAYTRHWKEGALAERGWLLPAVFWTALAAGVLIKGPLIFMVVGLTGLGVIAFDRSAGWLKRLRPLPGLLWLLLLVLPWFTAIVWRSGTSFFVNAVGHDMLGKVTTGQESHGAPPGYYLALFWATFWPGAVLAGLAAPAVWHARRERGARFLLAWLIPSWIVFEVVATKLPHYVLPLYPAVAIMIAGALERGVLSRRPLLQHGTLWWFLFPLIVLTLAVAAMVVFGRQLGLPAWPFAAGAVILGMLAWRLYESDGPELSLLRGCAAALLMSITAYAVMFPSLPRLFPSDTLARLLRHSPCKPVGVAAAGFHEPSLVFLAGTQTVMTDGAGAADFLRQGTCRYAFIDSRSQGAFVKRAEVIGLRYAAGPRVDGVNLGRTRAVTIAVFHSDIRP